MMTDWSRIEEEAAAWLAALDCGSADPVAFEAWRARDPLHAVAFVKLHASWQRVGQRDVVAAEAVREALPPAQVSRRRWMQAAAAVLVAGIGATVVATRSEAQEVSTGVGERRRLFIADETCLDLNTASSLRWKRDAAGFRIWLDRGEVSLSLAAESAPCTVIAGTATVQMAHGDFDVRLMGDQTRIAAVHGEARLLTGGASYRIEPRRRVDMAGAQANIRPQSDAQMTALIAWRRGELLFDGQPLCEAVAEYNRYLTTPMAIEDTSLGNLRLGGRFLTSDPGEFLKAIAANFGIRAERRGDRILLVRGTSA